VSLGAVSLAAFLASAPVLSGLDVVDAEAGRPLVGRRIGLVANAASVTLDGRNAVDVLRAHGVDVVRLFAPEHGLRGTAAAGEAVASRRDPGSGLPVVSLYGSQRRPSPADLRDLDMLVFDLQDAGVRFYTYESTLLSCLDAAADAGLALVVLDRPNPLGGSRLGGPEADADRRTAFLSMAPGPLIHGLTLGELARLENAGRARPARLRVVAMRGWRRSMTWPETGRPWVPPSPNLRTAEAALAYPGTALLEATNVSEGRGTEAPFLLFGAPWLAADVSKWTAPGFALAGATFTPRRAAAAPEPKAADAPCRGGRVGITDPRAADPWRLGLSLLARLRAEKGFAWLRGGAALDALVGTTRLRHALERGEGPDAIAAADAAAVAAFAEKRRAFLLY
jgi:uncharacterized protein YbbC (DUF1343 family)